MADDYVPYVPIPYTPLPYVSSREYSNRPYTQSLMELVGRAGQREAEATRRRSELLASRTGALGQIASSTLGSLFAGRDEAAKLAAAREQQRLENDYRERAMQAAADERKAAAGERGLARRYDYAKEARNYTPVGQAVPRREWDAIYSGTPSESSFTPEDQSFEMNGSPYADSPTMKRMADSGEQLAINNAIAQERARVLAAENRLADIERQSNRDKALEEYREDQLKLSGRRLDATERNTNALLSPPVELGELPPDSQDIMGQTGLSFNAFQVATGRESSVARGLPRTRAGQEVAAFARKRNVDVSTLTSQYKAYNKTLSENIERQNNIISVQDELVGDIANLRTAANALRMDNVRVANATKLWVGNQLNDANSADYAFALQALVNDIARYNAASTGRAPLQSDMDEAKATVLRGVSEEGLAGLQASLNRAVKGMNTVMDNNVNRSRRNIWKLFGVEDKFIPTVQQQQPNPDDETNIDGFTVRVVNKLPGGG